MAIATLVFFRDGGNDLSYKDGAGRTLKTFRSKEMREGSGRAEHDTSIF